ncbi:MAG: signal peptidase I [Candidatus Dadabacteria bacterium]
MPTILSNESQTRNKAKKLISTTRSLLENNASKIKTNVAEIIRERLNQTQDALRDGDLRNLTARTEELQRLFDDHLSKFKKSGLRQNIESLIIAIALALFIRTFIVQPFKIPSGSMIPTLLIGDHLLVSKFIYGTKIPFTDKRILPLNNIKRGDIIVFTYPDYENDPSKKGVDYIKRVIGIPGDSIDVRGRNLYINGQEIPLKYLGDFLDKRSGLEYDEYEENLFGRKHLVMYLHGKESTEKGSYLPVARVPQGRVFVMGDNRDNSQDSRFWGYVPVENIAGRAFIIHWSWDWDSNGILDKVRWNRIFTIIH